LLSKDEIHANLRNIVDRSSCENGTSCGILTAEDRAHWASLREHLSNNKNNSEVLRKMDGALFVLCLDDKKYSDEYEAMKMFLHGDGNNRWFDKSFQLIVEGNGEAAIHFEHAWGDGVAVMRFFNEIHKESTQENFEPQLDIASTNVSHHEFELDDGMKNVIANSKDKFGNFVSKLSFHAQEIEDFGKNYFKDKKLSPDGVLQLAFQIAYHRMYGCAVPTYESCSTAAFKHGRTETIRPATMQTLVCAEAFEASNPSGVDEMADLVGKSSEMHGKLTKEAAMGQGFDRHLFALANMALKTNRKVNFFEDTAYQKMNHIILSTSTVFSPFVRMGGFAPVTPNGLGVGYMINDNKIGCNVSAYPDSPNCKDFVENIIKSLYDIHSVLEGRNFKKV